MKERICSVFMFLSCTTAPTAALSSGLETDPCTLRVALSFWAKPAGAQTRSRRANTHRVNVRIMRSSRFLDAGKEELVPGAGAGYFQSSSASSSSSSMKPSSSSSSSSSSSAFSSSRGAVPITLRAAPHSSQLMVSPSSTSSSSTSILPSHAGHVTISNPPEYLQLYDRQPRLQQQSSRGVGLFGGLLRQPAPRGRRNDSLQPKIHEKLGAMGQFVLLDSLHHFEARHLLPVHSGNEVREELRRLGGQLRGTLRHRFPQGVGQFRGVGIGGQRAQVRLHAFHAIAEVAGEIFVTLQQQPGEAVARVQNVAGDFPECGHFGCRPVIQFAGREIFHGGGGVLPDGSPGIENLFHSDLDHIVREPAPCRTG